MKRFGVIIPSSNTTVEPEFSKALNKTNVSLHFTRITLNNVTVKDLQDMEKETEAAAKLLADAAVDLIAFACTSGSLINGLGYDKAIAEKIVRAAHCPAVTTSSAVVGALNFLKVKKAGLATPYIEEVTVKEVDFLNKNGFTVVSSQSLGIKENLKIGNLSSKDAQAIATKTDSPLAQAVFISCTNFQTFEALPLLESQLKKPVVSSNSATLWASLKMLNISVQLNLGKLFLC
ncbi:MAG: aspartate/glutamate racemase family protein [Candidatus Bathyarchaeia archaeon]|jgi:maleate isomerase